MAREYPKRAIASLVPYEPCYTSPKLRSALRDLKRDKKFDPPADIFELRGEWFVRDATHHVLAAHMLGCTEVPVVEVLPPGDTKSILEHWAEHMARKGFANLPSCAGTADRGARSREASGFKIDKDKVLESLGKVAVPRVPASNRRPDELARLGAEIFEHRVQPMLRPEDGGKFVAVDVQTGEYEIDGDDFAAVARLRARLPKAEVWLERAGQPTAYHMRRG